jgi:hypothetical protein
MRHMEVTFGTCGTGFTDKESVYSSVAMMTDEPKPSKDFAPDHHAGGVSDITHVAAYNGGSSCTPVAARNGFTARTLP